MSILPREQATQRRPTAAVSAAGVTLWTSETSYLSGWLVSSVVTDSVTEEDLLALAESPKFPDLDVETIANDIYDVAGNPRQSLYGMGDFGEGPFAEFGAELDGSDFHPDYPGVYEGREFGSHRFGEGPFGGRETVWARMYGPYRWNVGS